MTIDNIEPDFETDHQRNVTIASMLVAIQRAVLTSRPGKIDSLPWKQLKGQLLKLITAHENNKTAVVGTLFKHYRGDVYRALRAGFMEKDGTPVMYYRLANDDTAPIWVRPVSEFSEMVELDGVTTTRFKFYTEPMSPK